MEEKRGKTIRGLRRNEECTVNGGLPLNRDKNGAINTGTNFRWLFEDKADEDIAFHRATYIFTLSGLSNPIEIAHPDS